MHEYQSDREYIFETTLWIFHKNINQDMHADTVYLLFIFLCIDVV